MIFVHLFISFLLILSPPLLAAKRDISGGFPANRYAAMVVDGDTGKVLYECNAHAKRKPASLTKKMSLYIVFDALQKRKITLNTPFYVSKRAMQQVPSKLGLKMGEYVRVQDLIQGLSTRSANDAAVVIAEGVAGSVENFVHLMNKKAVELGMLNTKFYNTSGLPDPRQATTAHDMIILAQSLYEDYPEFCHYFKLKSFNFRGAQVNNHNHLLGKVPGVVGIKTGYVCASGFNISVAAERNNRRIFAVVMGGKTRHIRDHHVKELIEIGFSKILGRSKNKKAISKILPTQKFRNHSTTLETETQKATKDQVREYLIHMEKTTPIQENTQQLKMKEQVWAT